MKILLFLALLGVALATEEWLPQPPPEECPQPTPEVPKCRYYTEKKAFGNIATNFNAFIRHDFVCQSSDVEGRLAVGGSLILQGSGGFDIGCKTYSTDGLNCKDVSCTDISLHYDYPYALVVGGNVVYTTGQIHSGRILVGGTISGTPSFPISDCNAIAQGTEIDFDAEFAALIETSQLLAKLKGTGTFDIDSGNNIFFHGTGAGLEVFYIGGAQLSAAKRISFDGVIPTATVIVNVGGTSIVAGNFGFDSNGLERNTLWNFHEATNLQLSSVGWRGTIFAPMADIVTVGGGVILGGVFANSYTGMSGCFQINWFEFRGCVPDNHPHVPPPGDVCVNPFGPIASDYNTFVFEDYLCINSDVEGRVAAGGNIHVKNWAAGCQIFTPSQGNCLNINERTCAELTANGMQTASLVAGISIDMENTQVQVGDVVYGYQLNNPSSTIGNDCRNIQSTSVIDFPKAQGYLVCLSETLAAMQPTGSYDDFYNQVVFKGTGTLDREIFFIAGYLLAAAKSVEFQNIKPGATIIVNVNGVNLLIGDFGFLGSVQQEFLLWNFFEATTLLFYSVGMKGAVLAPKAAIVDSNGVLIGQVFARAWTQGTQCMQNNWVKFQGCLPDCTRNPVPPTVGCADGQREGFFDQRMYPCIAACATSWSVPGVIGKQPTCSRQAGDDFPSQATGCSVEDACAVGWHVCTSQDEVSYGFRHGGSCYDAGAGFYISQVSGPGCGTCSVSWGSNTACTGSSCRTEGTCQPNANTRNDLFGCGTLTSDNGEPAYLHPDEATCGPFNIFSGDKCNAVPGLSCGTDGYYEADLATKSSTAGGGVLCCIDQCNDRTSNDDVIGK